mmetsp:Transcript_40611/g.128671  ORF Transcript_40611/g.128671 Transcript_40611/m.128671 type:complete len:327 (-) Transcript_40611:856-1836(-)
MSRTSEDFELRGCAMFTLVACRNICPQSLQISSCGRLPCFSSLQLLLDSANFDAKFMSLCPTRIELGGGFLNKSLGRLQLALQACARLAAFLQLRGEAPQVPELLALGPLRPEGRAELPQLLRDVRALQLLALQSGAVKASRSCRHAAPNILHPPPLGLVAAEGGGPVPEGFRKVLGAGFSSAVHGSSRALQGARCFDQCSLHALDAGRIKGAGGRECHVDWRGCRRGFARRRWSIERAQQHSQGFGKRDGSTLGLHPKSLPPCMRGDRSNAAQRVCQAPQARALNLNRQGIVKPRPPEPRGIQVKGRLTREDTVRWPHRWRAAWS